jgi:hypothetical protein
MARKIHKYPDAWIETGENPRENMPGEVLIPNTRTHHPCPVIEKRKSSKIYYFVQNLLSPFNDTLGVQSAHLRNKLNLY